MAGSQKSFDTRLQRFINGNTLIQGWADYTAAQPLITKANLVTFVNTVTVANSDVATKLAFLSQKRDERRLFCFNIGTTNPACAQSRINNIIGYLGGEIGFEHAKVRALKAILKKIKPNYSGSTATQSFTLKPNEIITVNNVVNNALAKNTGSTNVDWNEVGGTNPPETVNPGEETTIIAPSGVVMLKNLSSKTQGKFQLEVRSDKNVENSPMEKSFDALVGQLNKVIDRISSGFTGGFAYSPPDAKLSVAGMTALRNQLVSINTEIANALDLYGPANRNRKDLYDHKDTGMDERIAKIKGYLRGFDGGKKSNRYIEFSDAIAGV